MGYPVQQATTVQPLLFLLVLSSDHVTGATGKTPTVTLSKNGGAFASPAGAVTEIGNGLYKIAGNATDNATLGPLALHVAEASSDPVDDVFMVVAYDPQDAVRLGLTALPNAAAGAAGGLAMAASLVTFPVATVTTTHTTTTVTVTGLADTTANAYKDSYSLFLTGVNAFAVAFPVLTSTYSGGTTTLTFTGLLAAPSAADTLILLGSLKSA